MTSTRLTDIEKFPKILIVDDEPLILGMLGTWLKNLGYPFGTATNGMEAVKALDEEMYDLVISDIDMPQMDGMQLLKHINKNFPHIDVILITGQAAEYSCTAAMEAGASYYLTKPFVQKDLKAVLKRLREHRDVIRQFKAAGK